MLSVASTIPSTRQHGSGGNIPGWSEFVAPLRDKSICWHNMCVECGRTQEGVVADIMNKTRSRYHTAIWKVRRSEADIVSSCFATLLQQSVITGHTDGQSLLC